MESFVQTDDGFVYATTDGQVHLADDTTNMAIGHTSPDTSGYELVAAYAWLDDSTVTLIGIERLGGGEQPIDILTCDVPGGTCRVAAEAVATFSQDGPPPLALPVGERLG